MSNSTLELWNRALQIAGVRYDIAAIDEDSNEALNCSLWYDVARKSALALTSWAFAQKQATLALLGGTILPFDYKYTYPTDCITFIRIFPAAGAAALDPSKRRRFVIRNDSSVRVILSNVPNAIGLYIMDATDVTIFPPVFDEALAFALASRLAIAGGDADRGKNFNDEAVALASTAERIDSDQAETILPPPMEPSK